MNAPFRPGLDDSDLGVRARPSFAVPLFACMALASVILAIGPIGYRGGGADDFHYLEAARCAARHGFCVPEVHWWSRFPLVAPMGGVFALFGEGRAQASAVPLIYGMSAVLLLARLVFDRYGAFAASVAGLILLGTPAFGGVLLDPNIDTAELAFLVGALFCLERCRRGGAAAWAPLAGLALALAVQSRPSALCALPPFALYILWAPALRARVLPIGLAFSASLSIEAALYAYWTGDPVLPWRLALAHGAVPSSELRSYVDTGHSPLFNPEFIGGWKPAAGIDAHWTVSGLVNLLGHPAIGWTLIAAALLMGLAWRRNGRRFRRVRDPVPKALFAAGAIVFAGLVYALAIDPKPRMFLPVAAAAAAIAGIAASRIRRSDGPVLPIAVVAGLCAASLAWTSGYADFSASDRIAGDWLRGYESQTALETNAATTLTLVPGATRTAERRTASRLLLLDIKACAKAGADLPAAENWRLARAAPIPSTIDRILGRPLRPNGVNLCLFTRDRVPSPGQAPPA